MLTQYIDSYFQFHEDDSKDDENFHILVLYYGI